MNIQEIAIAAADGGTFNAYLAAPDTGTHPGIVVIQEIFGVNEIMQKTAIAYAEAGYVAIVPDLFWRLQPNVQLNPHNAIHVEKAYALYRDFDRNKGIQDLVATVDTLRKLSNCTGKVGTIGFCMGGKLAYLMATRSEADCHVSYYGVSIERHLDELPNLKHPLMLHIAEKDEFVNPEHQATIQAAMGNHPMVSIHSYPGADHGFARLGSKAYDRETAKLANSRTREFLQQHLN